jgi:hypothetical protein
MSIVLRHQLEASEKSADALENQINISQAGGMVCHEVEAQMELVVDLFADMNHFVERWQNDIKEGKTYSDDFGSQLYDLYVRLEKVASRAGQFGRKLEGWGLQVAGKKQFLNAWRSLKGIVSISTERVAESFEQIRRGETRTLGEFADELSRDRDR